MAEEEEFVILYTAQKTKKAKTWHDGILKVSSAASKAVLYDEKKARLDTLFVKAADVHPGEQIESDRYLILIEEKRSQDAKTSSSSNVPSATSSSCAGRPATGSKVQSAPGLGLRKGKRKGFLPPRICKQVETDPSSADLPSISALQVDTSRLSPLQGMTRYKASIMNLYSRNTLGLDQTSSGAPKAGPLDSTGAFPKDRTSLCKTDQNGSLWNQDRTVQRGLGLSTVSGSESQGTGHEDSDISPQLTSFMSMLHGRRYSRERSPSGQERKRLKCNPWRTFGSRSNSDSQGSQTSDESSQEPYKTKTFTTNHSVLKPENDKCNKTEVIQTDSAPNSDSLGSSSHIGYSVNRSQTNFAASTKRSASQIMALLKHRTVPNICENVNSEDMTSKHALPKSDVFEEVAVEEDNNSSDFRMEESGDGAGFPDDLSDTHVMKSNDIVLASDNHECLGENNDNENEEGRAINPFELSDATFDIDFSPLSHVSSSDEDEDEQTDLKDQDCLVADTAGSHQEAPAVTQDDSSGREPGVKENMTDDNLHTIVGCVNPSASPVMEQERNPSGIELDARQAFTDDNIHHTSESTTSEYPQEAALAEDSPHCAERNSAVYSPMGADTLKQLKNLSETDQDARQVISRDNPLCTSEGAAETIPKEAVPVKLTEKCSETGEEAGQTLGDSVITSVEEEDLMLIVSTRGHTDAGSVDSGLIQLSKADLIHGNMNILQDTQELTVFRNIKDGKPENIDSQCSDRDVRKFIPRRDDGCPDGNPETVPASEGHNDYNTLTDKMGNIQPYPAEAVEQNSSQISAHASPEIHCSINPLSNLQFSPDSFDLNSSLSQFSQCGFLVKLNAASAVSDRAGKASSSSLKSPSDSAFDESQSKQSGFNKECPPLQVRKQSELNHVQPEELTADFSGIQASLSVEAGKHNTNECKDLQNQMSSNVQHGIGTSCQDEVTNTPDNDSEPLPSSQHSHNSDRCSLIPQQEDQQSKQHLKEKPESCNDTPILQEKEALCSISKPEFDNTSHSKQHINNQNTHTEQDSVGDMFSSPIIKHDTEYSIPSSCESVTSTILGGDVGQVRLANKDVEVLFADSDKSFPMPDTPDIPLSGSQKSQDTIQEYPQEVSNHSSDENPQQFQRTLTETVQRQYLTSDSMISMQGCPQHECSLKVSSPDQEVSVIQADRQTLKHIPSTPRGHLRLNPAKPDGHHKPRYDLAICDRRQRLRQNCGIPDGQAVLSHFEAMERQEGVDAAPPLFPPSRLGQDPRQAQDVRCQISRKLDGYSVKGMVSSGVVRRDPLRSTYTQDLPEDPLGGPTITGVRSTRPYSRTDRVTKIQLKAATEKVSSDCKQTDSQTSPELSDLLCSQFPLYQEKSDSLPEQFKLRMGSVGHFPVVKRNDFHEDFVSSPAPSLHDSECVFGATSDDHWLVNDSQSSTSTMEPQPGLGHVPNITALLKSEPLQKLCFDTLPPADTDDEFYIDWNQGKPKIVSRSYAVEEESIKLDSLQDAQNVPESLRASSPPSSTCSSPINNHVVPDLGGDLRKTVISPRLEESADTTLSSGVHLLPLVSQQRKKPIKTNPSADGTQVDTYLESSGESETGGMWTREESYGGTGSAGTVDSDQLHGRSSRHLGQQQIKYCTEGFKRLNDVGESQQKKSNVFEKRIVISPYAAMLAPEASSHVLRKPTMESGLYRSSDVRSDRCGEGLSRYQGAGGWQQGLTGVLKEVGSNLSDRSGDGVYMYSGSVGWQQRQKGHIWEEEKEKIEVKTSRWGRYLNIDDAGISQLALKSQNIGSVGDPSGNSASDQKYKLPNNDTCVTSRNKSDDSLLYKILDSNCDNFFGRGIRCVPNSVKQQANHSSCDAVEDVDDCGTRTTSQLVDEFDDSFDEDCFQEDKAMLSVEETYKPKCAAQTENVQHSLHRGSRYIRNTNSSLSPDLFLTQEQDTTSVSKKFNRPMSVNSGGSTGMQTTRKVGLGKFRTPVMSFSSSTLNGSQRSLCGELQFPSCSEVEVNVTPSRQVVIPARFQNLQTYKQVIAAALREHLNIMLFELSKIYHSALGKVDVTQYSGDGGSSKLPNKSTASSNPPCKCGIPSKLVQVRKEGPNKGRFFFACEAPRYQQCKFFQWMDQPSSAGVGKTASTAGVTRATLASADGITAYIRGHSITFYCQCVYLHKYRDNYNKHRKGIPAWVRQRQEESRKKSMYIKLSRKDASSYFAKDDLWVVSQSLIFEPGKTFIARSVYFGPNCGNEVEIEPISGFSPSNWTNNCECHAMLTGNASTELACLGNLEEHVQLSCLPILPYILNRVEDDKRQRLAATSHTRLSAPGQFIMKLAEEYVSRFQLNKDQSEALWRVAAMMNKDAASEPVLLIHGVFGAGKSFLLSVIIRFLVDVFDKNDSYSPDVPFPWKLLISSTTNVAVDRVLMGLLNLGFEDFIRVGSVKKIAKPVLPYSVHASGSDSQELKDLQEMLRSDIPPGEKQLVRKSIEKHRLGENKKKLGGVRVVGATCAACSFNCLHNMHFPFVVLDECSQMTEPSSLLPIARFSCEKLVLVGDPKQLDPTIQGSEAAHSDGLEQTLFDRLMKLDYCPVLLRTQYRCHPRISGIANTLFYSGQLCDGVTEDSRQPLSPVFPTLCFYDEAGGQEVTDGSGSYYNESEARLVVLLIHALVVVGVEAGNIGVITLYKAQMYKIITSLHTDNPAVNKELKCVQVSTVDAFQGAEKDVIILSSVRTNNIGFIDSDKRANVALTRARHHLLIVGHQKNLSRNKLWSRVIQLCRAHPGGLQTSSTASVELATLVEERQSQTVTGSSQEGQDKGSMGQGKKKRMSRKRKRGKEEEDSPPMSLSGQSTDSSGWSVEVLTPPDVPVNDNNVAGVEAADAGIGQKTLLTEDFVLSECSVNTLSKDCSKYKRPHRSHFLDPDVFLDDKKNSSDEDLPSYM